MTGLVLEGGTFRGTFSAGFMDALIEENIEFPYIVGVSAVPESRMKWEIFKTMVFGGMRR